MSKPLNIKYPVSPSTIGEHLRKRRYNLSLTQAQIAIIIGVTEDSITYWENDRYGPQIHYYKKIIDFLGYNPFEFEIKTWGDNLKHYHYINGLTQKALGKMTGIDLSTIAAWENNLSVPKNRKKAKVEELLISSTV
ncbi:MAG: helix-turn-helix domain-containing protein [Bacteroidales bacterium]